MKPLRVTFESFCDAECVALAQLGQSNSVIMRDSKLTNSQINYRLRKAKDIIGQDSGFRVAWRKGESPLCQQIKKDMLAVMRQDIQRRLPRQLIKIKPKGQTE